MNDKVTMSEAGKAICVLERQLVHAEIEVREGMKDYFDAIERLSKAIKTRDAIEETMKNVAIVAARGG